MALQNFVDQVGPVVDAAWLNQVDVFVNSLFGGATSSLAARTAITAAASGANGDITSLTAIAGPIVLSGSAGTAGQVLTSAGPGLSPTWSVGSGSSGVSSFNTRTGAVTLGATDVTTAVIAGMPTSNVWLFAPTTATPGVPSVGAVSVGRIGSTALASTHGNTYAAFEVANNQYPGSTTAYANEYGINSVMISYANQDPLNPGWPQNVGIYHFGFQLGKASVWGSCIEMSDNTQTARAADSGALVALEIDVGINGTDNYQSSVGINCVAAPPTVPGVGVTTATPWVAFWANGQNNSASFNWQYAYKADSGTAASFQSTATGVYGLELAGTYTVGVNTADATIASGNSAIRMQGGQHLDWIYSSSLFRMMYNPSTGFLEFYNNAARMGYINISSGPDGNLSNGIQAGQLGSTNIWTALNTFSDISISGSSSYIGTSSTHFYTRAGFADANATGFTAGSGCSAANIASYCTTGYLTSYLLGQGFTSTQASAVEVAVRPVYCIASVLMQEIFNRQIF